MDIKLTYPARLPGGSLNISRLEMYIYLLHAVVHGEKTMKATTYNQRSMESEAKNALKWAIKSHTTAPALKLATLERSLLYYGLFIHALNRFVGEVIEEAA